MDELENPAERPQPKKVAWVATLVGAAIGIGAFFGIVYGDFGQPEQRAAGGPPPSAQSSEPAKPTLTAAPAKTEPHPSTIAPAAGGPKTTPTQATTEPAAPKAQPAPAARTAAAAPSATATPATPKSEVAAPGRSDAPRFDVVRIAKDRLAVMAGRGPAGSKITLLDGKKPVAEAAADARGEWAVVVEKPMAGGAKELRLSAELADGRKVESEAPVLVLLPEDKDKTAKRPSAGAPTVVRLAAAKGESSRVLQRPTPSPTAAEKDADRLSLDAIDYDDDGKVIISGSAPDGAAVRAYLDNRPIGTAVASAERTWRLVPERAVAAGDYKLRLDHLGPDGHVLARLEVPFTRVEARLARRFSPGDRIVVQPGNNLWNIARHTYGRGILYSVIYERNSDQIRDPDLIYPGQIFSLPKITG